MGLRDRLRGLIPRHVPPPPRASPPRPPDPAPPLHPKIGVFVPVPGGREGARPVSVGAAGSLGDPEERVVVVGADRWEVAADAELLAARGFRRVGWTEESPCDR